MVLPTLKRPVSHPALVVKPGKYTSGTALKRQMSLILIKLVDIFLYTTFSSVKQIVF